MTPYLITPPANLAVSLEQAKAQMFVTFNDYDDLITTYIEAATAHVDGYSGILGRCLISQEWAANLTSWPAGLLPLPFPNVTGVVVSYVDQDGAEQVVQPLNYSIIKQSTGSALVFKQSFDRPSLGDSLTVEPITVLMTCGYGPDAQNVPAPIRLAIMQLVAHYYENRTAVSELSLMETPMAVDRLLTPYRMVL